ncbi:hypothetical protein Ddye_003811 [Dipteronia dyeriana]|uniref:Uncharacterized protein n=1 Tax=Dipteronia dyeriana TaxID=168575 RepID=A0AAD9XU60_9ROSI|nr:hypothetical protein Ddye_003811 [Dipteronia dyeriana]
MGICSSTDNIATAKLIIQDGGVLKEFSYPVRVACVLQENPTCFICNSDDMDFDKVLTSMGKEEELQPGELYFALPLSWLDSPLRAEDLASLAVKGGLALQLVGGGEKCCCKCGFKRIDHVIKVNSRRVDCGEMETVGGGGGGGCVDGCDVGFVVKRKERSSGGGGRRGKFATKLSVILEDEKGDVC